MHSTKFNDNKNIKFNPSLINLKKIEIQNNSLNINSSDSSNFQAKMGNNLKFKNNICFDKKEKLNITDKDYNSINYKDEDYLKSIDQCSIENLSEINFPYRINRNSKIYSINNISLNNLFPSNFQSTKANSRNLNINNKLNLNNYKKVFQIRITYIILTIITLIQKI